MSYAGTNNMGPYLVQTTEAVWPTYGVGNPYVDDGTGTNPGPPAVPQSASGSVTNESATWNYAHSETSTQDFLDVVLNVESAQQGTAALTHAQIVADQPLNVSSRNLVNLGN